MITALGVWGQSPGTLPGTSSESDSTITNQYENNQNYGNQNGMNMNENKNRNMKNRKSRASRNGRAYQDSMQSGTNTNPTTNEVDTDKTNKGSNSY